MATNKGKNIGEWSEMYIFFKLMSDRKVYVADKDMNRLKDVFLNIISIIREENKGKEYRYFTGDVVKITLNGEEVATVDSSRFTDNAKKVWDMIISKKDTTFSDQEVIDFLSSIEKQFKNARILVLDPHGEYNTVFKRSSSVYKIGGDYTTSKQLYVPYWALPFNELISLFDAPITDANREYIREKIVHAKVKGAEVNGIKIDSVLISADSPIPFSIKKLWFDLDDFERQTFNKRGDPDSKTELVEKGDPDRLKSNIYQPASTTNSPPFTNNQAKGLLSFLESIRLKLTDTRYNFLFSPGEYTPDKEGKIQKDISELLSDWFDSQKAISIFDLSNVPAELMLSITGTLLNIVYDALFWGQNLSNGGKRRPLLIVLEEAHNYLHNGKASIASRTVQRIAREGRKYGIGLMLVTQRPSELDETVLSQCGTIVALRMNNNKDRAYVSGAIQDELRSLIDLLPSMRTGEAIISGEGVKIPSRVQFFRLNGAYKGSDPAVSELWRNAPENENSYAELVKLWRNKKFTLEENESE